MFNSYQNIFDCHDRFNVDVDFINSFVELLEKLSIPKNVAKAIAKSVYYRMSDEKLCYHTPVHILNILDFAERNKVELTDLQKLAIYFHDVIYVPGKTDNEDRSVDVMRGLVGAFLSDSDLDYVESNIKATKYFLVKDEDVPEGLRDFVVTIMDLDLSSFTEENSQATELIKKEFALEDKVFYEGRIKFLEALLDRKPIFRTKFFQENFEEKALRNISKDLDICKEKVK